MSSKRPSNGPNLSERRSNLRSKGRKWKEQLVQGDKEKAIKEALMARLEEQRILQNNAKLQLKEEARKLNIELGFVDPEAEEKEKKVPEWKKQKLFLNATFPPLVICRKFKDQVVYRNKMLMQEYLHRQVTAEEWESNCSLLAEMREIYDGQQARLQLQADATAAAGVEVSDSVAIEEGPAPLDTSIEGDRGSEGQHGECHAEQGDGPEEGEDEDYEEQEQEQLEVVLPDIDSVAIQED